MTIQSIQAASGQTSTLAAQYSTVTTSASAGAQGASVVTPTTDATSTTQNVDATTLAGAIDKVQDFTNTLANELKFNIDEESGQTVVKIVDSATDEVIRQIPSEEMLAIADALDQIQGLLIKQKA